jgi:uncharacterized protein with FMN-binding domain
VRRIVLWLLSTISAVVVLFNFSSSTAGPLPSMTAAPVTVKSAKAGKPAGKPQVSTSQPNAPVPKADPAKGAITLATGPTVQTRWGPVQVQLDIQNHKIVAVTLLKKPDSNAFTKFINDRATPALINETVAAQGLKIDMVTGATYTSTGYLKSLQSALDTAGL